MLTVSLALRLALTSGTVADLRRQGLEEPFPLGLAFSVPAVLPGPWKMYGSHLHHTGQQPPSLRPDLPDLERPISRSCRDHPSGPVHPQFISQIDGFLAVVFLS